LLINVAFFLAHPLYTQYYLVPICALSLWTMLFEMLLAPSVLKQATEAISPGLFTANR
jgi:hypothetical protein